MQEQPYLEQPSRPEEPLPSARREAFSLLIIVICAALVTTFLALFIFRTYQVEGPSMQNTLNNGDKLIIWKVPRTWAKITGHAYIPARGDVIVFNESGLSTYGQQDNKQLIKRVIGLPGDHLIVSGGNVTIYNQAHPSGFDPDKTMGYHIVNPTSGNVNIMLSSHELFMEGDNRPNSLDSRAFGPIDTSQVVGKLVLRVFPINKAGTF